MPRKKRPYYYRSLLDSRDFGKCHQSGGTSVYQSIEGVRNTHQLTMVGGIVLPVFTYDQEKVLDGSLHDMLKNERKCNRRKCTSKVKENT
ncbi:hypothetical protein JTB14_000721 [Gonioctena quinquepunctata]|nr:hypothetical protein JTB14_000721 [Gonioctena quinquepunctata]